jgi:hypothetical protein
MLFSMKRTGRINRTMMFLMFIVVEFFISQLYEDNERLQQWLRIWD